MRCGRWHGLSPVNVLCFWAILGLDRLGIRIDQFQADSRKIECMENATISRPLTAKQSRFIDEYMVDMNGAAAAVRCGYSKKTSRAIACELLTKPHLQAELQRRGAALARELEITRAGVVKGLMDAFEMARADQQPSIMVSSMAAVAKLLGLYAVETKRVELTAGQDAAQANFAAMSDAQLLALMAQGAAESH